MKSHIFSLLLLLLLLLLLSSSLSLCACFVGFSSVGLSLSALHHIPRRQFSGVTEKIIKVFHLKPSEVKRAKELEKLLQPLY